mmetsp:Transcript_61028/g.189517  ORF Transcript_61028/g.189517 Transcript_61028/m.189517 type:complete len:275 (+) Transcript_61028:485-1309(+)
MDHVELCGCVFARKCQDCELTAGVLREEVRHIQHATVQHHPAVTFRDMFCNLLHAVSSATSCCCFGCGCRRRFTCRGRCRCASGCGALVHAIFIRPSSKLRALHLAGEAATCQLRERCCFEVTAKHVLRASLACYAAEDNAIEERIAAKAVVSVHATRNLARGVQTRDCLARFADDRGIRVDLQATHAVMDDRRNDSHIERLRLDSGTRNDVVVELLARTSLATGLIPRLSRGVSGPRAAIWVLLGLFGCLIVYFRRLLQDGQGNAHVFGKRLA